MLKMYILLKIVCFKCEIWEIKREIWEIWEIKRDIWEINVDTPGRLLE